MKFYQKISFLFSASQKSELKILAVLILIGMFFEMLGLGIMIPALTLMLKTDLVKEYPSLQPYLKAIGNPTQPELVFYGISLLVFVYVAKAIYMVYLSWRQNHFSSLLSAELADRLFLGYLRQPYIFHIQRNSSELLQNIQHEVNVFNVITVSSITIIAELSMAISVAAMLIIIEPIGAISVILFIGLFATIFSKLTQKKLLIWGKGRQFHLSLLTKNLIQGISGVKDVKISGRENYFLSEFQKHNLAQARINTRVHTLATTPRLYLELLAAIGLAALISIMILQSRPLHLLVPTLGVFGAAAFRLIPSLNRIMTSLQSVRYSQPVIDLLYKELTEINDYENSVLANGKIELKSKIQIDKLVFNYPMSNINVLKNVSLTIEKGESVGFIGPSGSGKSSLVDLILGLLKPVSGFILVDGQDIQQNLRHWQNKLGYVPQSIYLTDDTLRRNVAFGIIDSDINDELVNRAIKAAQLEEFIENTRLGLDTVVGERGVRLSGGQRQRIGIARALYHDPEVLVFDEATSALDSDTERNVVETIKSLQGDKTILVIAHRLSTIKYCDRVYKVDDGQITELDLKEVLLNNSSKG
jgi:ABC-type multidrug transport system fused ATPase/permease subunit